MQYGHFLLFHVFCKCILILICIFMFIQHYFCKRIYHASQFVNTLVNKSYSSYSLFFFQIFYYSFKLFTSAGISDDLAAHATSGIGAIMVVMTLITIPLMDRIGRRSLHLTGLAGMFVFSILITITLSLTVIHEGLRLT